MEKVTPVLWFNDQAEEAVAFYVTLLPDSRIVSIFRSPLDTPSGPAGKVLTVEFLLAGRHYIALNGGPYYSSPRAYPSKSLARTKRKSITFGPP